MQRAVRALRHEHDARRSAELIDEYLHRYPRGDLIEESLALGVEAHAQLDDGRAAPLAAQYLKRFPSGRFRVEVARARGTK